jgi:hypothetical protein
MLHFDDDEDVFLLLSLDHLKHTISKQFSRTDGVMPNG